jgi:hypothetical protein
MILKCAWYDFVQEFEDMSLNTDRLEDFVSQFEKNAVGNPCTRNLIHPTFPDIRTPLQEVLRTWVG